VYGGTHQSRQAGDESVGLAQAAGSASHITVCMDLVFGVLLSINTIALYASSICNLGRCSDVSAHPSTYAAYAASVRHYRYLQYRLLQCMNDSTPPCCSLMLRARPRT
jgi:hypothetical protein